MDELQLSDTLQRYFNDFFVYCDVEHTGKVPINKIIELIKSGKVPEDILTQVKQFCLNTFAMCNIMHLQIADICWSQNATNINRKQFYSALKLVAAYQSNISLRNDILNTNVELPLPRFTWPNSSNPSPVPDLIQLCTNDLNEYQEHVDVMSTDSEVDSDTLNVLVKGSPNASSTASDSPTPTNSVQDRSWAVSGRWQGLISEEQRQLLG